MKRNSGFVAVFWHRDRFRRPTGAVSRCPFVTCSNGEAEETLAANEAKLGAAVFAQQGVPGSFASIPYHLPKFNGKPWASIVWSRWDLAFAAANALGFVFIRPSMVLGFSRTWRKIDGQGVA